MTKQWIGRMALACGVLLLGAGAAGAQTPVTLPDTSQTTTFNANVSEQATVTVPATVTFTVSDVTQTTDSAAQAVTVTSIVLETATKQLKISIQANAASFTPPAASTTWDAGDVSWNAGTWTDATGASGTLSDAAYNEIATCDAGVAGCSVADLVFTLAAKPGVTIAGTHSLVATWKFESIGA